MRGISRRRWRMPETGPRHDPGCDSCEAPYELSGFVHVAGAAIQENVEDGVTVLKLDFSLSKTGAKPTSALGQGADAGSVKTGGLKLSLRALLHYLRDQAEFNRWRPGMLGERNWAVIRKFLTQAADGRHFDPDWFDLSLVDKDLKNALKANIRRRLHQPKPRSKAPRSGTS